MYENITRMKSGWPPRPDAHWFYWALFDIKSVIGVLLVYARKRFHK